MMRNHCSGVSKGESGGAILQNEWPYNTVNASVATQDHARPINSLTRSTIIPKEMHTYIAR
eukprot:25940-Ditylum_brightwellii.AAC.1